jgi:TetR/AcrR family transcriptional regulator, tetracycline repressor protein
LVAIEFSRGVRLDAEELPLLRQSGPILFDRFDRRYKEGLELILRGAAAQKISGD